MKPKAILFALVLFLLLDAGFIFINYTIFRDQVIDVQRVTMIPKNLGVIAAYALVLFAFYYFILRTRRSVFEAALLGLVVNGVYELTNYSLLKKWRLQTVVLDTLWGAALWGMTTYITYEVFYP
jgi:uncharacterized membrane protein